ncbi:hypothetical protein [Microbacterium sp. XT11]|uniref:hypothetical protein n=1 Tax=Microbacterium sp. XT11 TaxID=367477 RepID=UPI0008332E8B|nr:hypothetical protein [Microbacterium sp. XT11]
MITDTDIFQAELRRWVERYEQHLDQLPVLLEHLRDRANPMKAGSLEERVGGGGGDTPAPFRLDPVDDCDDLWSSLVEYIGEVAERLQDPAPGAAGASWAVKGSVRGIPAWMGPDEAYRAAYELIAWLIDRAEKVHALALKDSEDHLFSLIRKLMTRYVIPPIERPSHRRLCIGEDEEGRMVGCGERAVVVDWIIGDVGEARCAVCGAVYTREEDTHD